ncbi:MAG: hypothetical protein FWD81_01855 [Methanomassiliicoccaceae archaeon]|nr:hypothetical protein [Methanomassiliicoccaceae archaeon]
MFCSRCGNEVENQAFCDKCGNRIDGADGGATQQTQQRQEVYRRDKSDGLAAVLSLLIPGAGQIYVGKIGRGIGLLVLAIVIASLALLFFWLIVPLIFYVIFWIWNIFDAYNLAKEYNTLLETTGNRPW